MSPTFSARLHERVLALDTRVCLGIDPRPARHVEQHSGAAADTGRVAESIVSYFADVLTATHDLIACCKPQSAFFEALGPAGSEALARVMAHARALGVPVLLDVKRGDIGTTAAAYAGAYLGSGRLGADAVTVNPYLGLDAMEPFVAAADDTGKGVFVLVKTSNDGSRDLQDVVVAGGAPLYLHLAAMLRERSAGLAADARGYTCLGAVVGATQPAALAAVRAALPASLLLVPGFGSQGGTAEGVAAAFDGEGLGAIVSASRSLTYPTSEGRDTAAGVRAATDAMRVALNRVVAAG